MVENPLVMETRKLTSHGFPIIPLKDKIAITKYKHRRKELATAKEIDLWFSKSESKTPRANGIAIAINDTEFGIDTDGEKCESLFLDKIVSNLSAELQDKVCKTMHTKTPHGYHRTFRYIHEDLFAGLLSLFLKGLVLRLILFPPSVIGFTSSMNDFFAIITRSSLPDLPS
jgi:hypothetical protein